MPRFSPSGSFGLSRCLIPTPGLTSKYLICAACVYVCVYTHTLPPALKIEKTQTTPLSFLLSKNNPPRQATSAFIDLLNPAEPPHPHSPMLNETNCTVIHARICTSCSERETNVYADIYIYLTYTPAHA